jgi:hypothetical protein
MEIFDIIIPDCPPRSELFMKVILSKSILSMRLTSLESVCNKYKSNISNIRELKQILRVIKYICEDIQVRERSPEFNVSESETLFSTLIDLASVLSISVTSDELNMCDGLFESLQRFI